MKLIVWRDGVLEMGNQNHQKNNIRHHYEITEIMFHLFKGRKKYMFICRLALAS